MYKYKWINFCIYALPWRSSVSAEKYADAKVSTFLRRKYYADAKGTTKMYTERKLIWQVRPLVTVRGALCSNVCAKGQTRIHEELVGGYLDRKVRLGSVPCPGNT